MHNKRNISIIGLGYVGLPVALAFGKLGRTVAFDVSPGRVKELRRGEDKNREVSASELQATDILFTSDPKDLRKADFHIIAVPTPIDDAHQPDLGPLLRATETVGSALKKGDIVVYESTVYPGVTEEVCLPALEKASGLKGGRDFTVGYSPERINPGDREHTFTRIRKVVSGQDARTLDIVAEVYGSVVTAGVHKASSIKTAEAAKVIENTQRDLNIALMNELAVLFHELGIDTLEVLEAAGTKWNFLPFRPGLVGGHCIGVDPYYLTHKADTVGYHPEVILAGRRINDNMGKYVAQQTIKQLARAGHTLNDARVTVLGLTFKEDCPDLRNSRVIDIIRELESFGVSVQVHDPIADPGSAAQEYGVKLQSWKQLKPADALVLAVAHKGFCSKSIKELKAVLRGDSGLIVDVKGMLPRSAAQQNGVRIWRL